MDYSLATQLQWVMSFPYLQWKAELRWRMERCRIIQSIETSLSDEDREREENVYWVTLNGRPYLQVEEQNQRYYDDAKVSDDLGAFHIRNAIDPVSPLCFPRACGDADLPDMFLA